MATCTATAATSTDRGPAMSEAHDDVLIVGGGVIGLSCALALLDSGRGVRVLEAGTAGCGSSHGNCGTLTPSHAHPLASPGAIGKALRWMFTPDAPFYVAPRFDPALWRWLLAFAANCNARDWRRGMDAKAALLVGSRNAFPDWVARHAPDSEFREDGVDYVYRDRRALDEAARELPVFAECGIASEVIDGAAYERREPALKPGVAGVIRFPGDGSLRPDAYVAGLARSLRAAGGLLDEQREVLDITREDGGLLRVRTSAGEYRARDVIVATGAWAPKLARAAGLGRVPIQPGKGYSMTYDRPALVPRGQIVLVERSVCVTTWGSGYRLGSTMELSGYDTSLNRRRMDALERGAAEYLHDPVGPVKREEWFGWRPLTSDDVPIIGRAPGHEHLWLATGHGMLGVSMSPETAVLVADLVCGRTPRIDPAPYAPSRFA